MNNTNEVSYKPVATYDKLNVGITKAYINALTIGTEYIKNIGIMISTAEISLMVDVSIKTLERFVDQIDNNEKLKPIILECKKQFPKIIDLLENNISLIKGIW